MSAILCLVKMTAPVWMKGVDFAASVCQASILIFRFLVSSCILSAYSQNAILHDKPETFLD